MLYKRHKKPAEIALQALSFPFIWLPLFPLILMDIVVEIYHHICFPLYRIPLVKRRNYIVFDRFKLSYITIPEKLYCLYCSYANGFFHYATKIGLETEKYWCGIKHKNFPGYVELVDHKEFVEYGDEGAYRRTYSSASE